MKPKQIRQVRLESAEVLTPAQMNAIHFGGTHTPLTPEEMKG